VEKSGKWLILAILAVALASGAFSWWFRWSATHRAAAFWGPEAATTIRDAQHVEAFRLATTSENTDRTLKAGDREYPVEKRIDASKAHGLIHLKQALVEDRSYDWDTSIDAEKVVPRWALVFHPHAERPTNPPVTLLLDDACEHGVRAVEEDEPRAFDCGRIGPGVRKVLSEWLAADVKSSNP
jgi:hypothetical protein